MTPRVLFRAGTWHAVALLALSLAAPAAARAAATQAPRELDPVERCVLDAIGHPERSVEEHARVLAALGASGLARGFELAVRRELVVGVDAAKSFQLPISDDLERALVEAVSRAPRADLVRFLDQLSARETTPAEVEVALRILALAGEASELELARRLAVRHASEAGAPMPVRQAFEAAYGSIARRDPRALQSAWRLYQDVDRTLADALIRALGTLEGPAAVGALAGLLGTRRELDLRVLGELARVARSLPLPAPGPVREAVRPYLNDADPALQRAACRASLALQDVDALPIWIELLDGERELARAAHEALQRLTRKALRPDPAQWEQWHRRELAEWRLADGRAAGVLSRDRAVAVESILALGRTRLFRHDAARMVAAGLERPEPDLVRLCCQVLGELGSPAGESALRSATAHDDEGVRAAAALALERLRARSEARRS